MRAARRWLLIGTVLALTCALVSAVIAALAHVPDAPPGGRAPLAVVLIPGLGRSQLVVVDLDRAQVVRRIELRSLATDISADMGRGLVIGAQTGGVGDAADDAISLVDPRSGDVRYVTLPRSDPSQVEVLAGRAVILHSWIDSSGFVVSAVDLASESVAADGRSPDGTGLWAAAGGSIWTAAATPGTDECVLVRLDPVTLSATRIQGIDVVPSMVVPSGDAVAVLGTRFGDPLSTGRIVLLDARSDAVIATTTISVLAHGAQMAAVAGDVLVVGDWNGNAPESNTLAVVDRRSLASVSTISVGRAPCALTGLDAGILVVDRIEGVLRKVDPVSGVVEWAVDLGARELACSTVLVFPR